jgi:hypothetical protein
LELKCVEINIGTKKIGIEMVNLQPASMIHWSLSFKWYDLSRMHTSGVGGAVWFGHPLWSDLIGWIGHQSDSTVPGVYLIFYTILNRLCRSRIMPLVPDSVRLAELPLAWHNWPPKSLCTRIA